MVLRNAHRERFAIIKTVGKLTAEQNMRVAELDHVIDIARYVLTQRTYCVVTTAAL